MYRFQFKYDFEDAMTMCRVHEKVHRRWPTLIVRVFGVALGIFALLDAAFLIALGTDSIGLCVVLMVLGLLLLSEKLWRPRLNAWQIARVSADVVLTVALEEDGVRSESEKGESWNPWSAFDEAWYSKERYLLFLDKRHVVILREQALVKGDPAGLRVFLEDKLQMEIKEI